MTIPQGTALSTMDDLLSRDPVLSKLATLFPAPALPSELAERPEPPTTTERRRPALLRRDFFTKPEVIAVTAIAVLVVCVVLSFVFNSWIIAVAGVGATLLLGVGCHFALKRARAARSMGVRVQQ